MANSGQKFKVNVIEKGRKEWYNQKNNYDVIKQTKEVGGRETKMKKPKTFVALRERERATL